MCRRITTRSAPSENGDSVPPPLSSEMAEGQSAGGCQPASTQILLESTRDGRLSSRASTVARPIASDAAPDRPLAGGGFVGCGLSSSPGDEPGDVVPTFFQQSGGVSPYQHRALVLSHQLRRNLLFCCCQSLILAFFMESFQAAAGLGGKSLPGGKPERFVIEEPELRYRVGQLLRQPFLLRCGRLHSLEELRFDAATSFLGSLPIPFVYRIRKPKRYRMTCHLCSPASRGGAPYNLNSNIGPPPA
jgi:hypothetical protein